jgi:light-regulated signal transduction histidine kinase (bacteriophytochrome)
LDEGIQKAIEQFSTVRSRALIQSNRDLEYFAAIAAHDLKAPLATISGYMELLDENLQNKISFEDAQYIKTIKKSTAQMTVLIDRLLEYSSIGRKVEPFAPLFVSEVVQRATDNLRELITSTSAKVIFKDVPQVTGEISLLTQLFQNLINNAIKFRDPKRVPEIRIEVTEHDSEWIFSVRDNGIGFKPEDKEHIFSLFKKSHSLQTQTGYGIGLATARKVVELHGGKIWAESEPGIGSTFYFTIAKTPW